MPYAPIIPTFEKKKNLLIISYNEHTYNFDLNTATMRDEVGKILDRAPTYWKRSMDDDWRASNDLSCNPWYQLFRRAYENVNCFCPSVEELKLFEALISMGMDERELRESARKINTFYHVYGNKYTLGDLTKAYKECKANAPDNAWYLQRLINYIDEKRQLENFGELSREEQRVVNHLQDRRLDTKTICRLLEAYRNEIAPIAAFVSASQMLVHYAELTAMFDEKIEVHGIFAHLRRLNIAYKLRKKELDKARFAKIYEKVNNLNFEYGDYQVIIPTCSEDFINEGNRQGNCVGGYVDTVLSGHKYVCFIRHKNDLDKPLITCDIYANSLNINQFLLAHNYNPNRKDHPDLIEFQEKFQEWLHSIK